ncbi:MAG: hypothetical protein ACRER2_03825 [Methylococcales bacterium]
MTRKRNPIARDPILRKGGTHVQSKSGRRHRDKHTLKDEIRTYFQERHSAPVRGRGDNSNDLIQIYN